MWVDGDRVRCSAPRGVLTPELQEEFGRRRDEILRLLSGSGREDGQALRRLPRDGGVALSFSQQRLWFLQQLMPDSAAYSIAASWSEVGQLDEPALQRAFDEIVRRHEVLRTVFVSRDGQPMQVIKPAGPVSIARVDLAGIPESARAGEADRLAREEAARPFDLTAGPLLRATVFRLGPDRHRLLIVVNHIVFDGWSLGVFAREMAALYEAFAAGQASPLAELPVQYADFALWQRDALASGTLKRQREYWQRQLAGELPTLDLPTDRPRPTQPTSEGASLDFTVPAEVGRAIRELGHRDGATSFMVMLAAFTALLHRYTGQEDIVVGSPIANRTRVELEALIGFFANTLVLRTDLAGDPTFRRLLERVRQVTLDAYEHQDMPFEQLVDDLHPERVLGRNPLFQVTFVFRPGGGGSSVEFLTVGSQFDLSMFVTEGADGVFYGAIEYSTALFDAGTIERLARHYAVLLTAAVGAPDTPVSALPILDHAETRRLLVDWNATTTAVPAGTVPSRFEAQARRTPAATAVSCGSERLSYAELDRRSGHLARRLRGLGVKPGVLVGVLVERSVDMLVALMAVLRSGGAYVPLDPSFPRERLQLMMEDAAVGVVLTRGAIPDGVTLPPTTEVLAVGDEGAAGVADVAEWAPAGDDDLAYVIYTSGSTGRPKGVEIRHRSLANVVAFFEHTPGVGPQDVWLAVTTLSFDIAALELLLPLVTGARVVLAERDAVLDPARLMALNEAEGVTIMQATPVTWRMMLDAGWHPRRPLKGLCGGEALPGDLARRLVAAGIRLWNVYGPTETTIWSTIHEVQGTEPAIPIGRPIWNTTTYVLDRYGAPVPIGVAGELAIGGAGVARGYRDRPELTAQQFVADRLSGAPDARLYRTGDLVRLRPDGNLQFVGRLDSQVKVRGFRIETGEVEAALLQHASVREAVVVAREDRTGGERYLAAYVRPSTPAPETAELRAFLRQRLPEYMVPSSFTVLDAFPLTPNGKVDRRRLPAPPIRMVAGGPGAAAPRDDLERRLVHIWEECLRVHPIGIDDDFFDIGGHSLLAIEVFAKLEKAVGQKLPIALIFQAPTVARLASVIREGEWGKAWRALVPIQLNGRRPPIFAVPGIDGQVIGFHRLAQLLGDDQPFYGLQSRGLDGRQSPLTRLEDIAAQFVREVRACYPGGPYLLVGACMGGVVAFEMAQQLRAAGQPVALLGLIDTWPPASVGRPPTARLNPLLTAVSFGVQRLVLYRRTMSLMSGKEKMRYLVGKLRMIREMIVQRDLFRGDPQEFRVMAVTHANVVAFRRYAPSAYPGPAVLFRAEDRRIEAVADTRLVWRDLTTRLDVVDVPGDTTGIVLGDPHVRVLAERLRDSLAALDGTSAGGDA